jgi:hypothetical protein
MCQAGSPLTRAPAFFCLLSESVHGRCHDEKALSFPPIHSSMGRNIFRTSRLFFINENSGVRVADDERVEVE